MIKPIPSLKNLYGATANGEIHRIVASRGKGTGPVRLHKGGNGKRYLFINAGLGSRKERKQAMVHRLVWEAFNGPIPEGMVICHVNNDQYDNRLDNLRLDTQQGNIRQSWDEGRNNHRHRKLVEISGRKRYVFAKEP